MKISEVSGYKTGASPVVILVIWNWKIKRYK